MELCEDRKPFESDMPRCYALIKNPSAKRNVTVIYLIERVVVTADKAPGDLMRTSMCSQLVWVSMPYP